MNRFVLFAVALIFGRSMHAAESVTIAMDGARQPQLAINSDGAVYLAFGSGNSIQFADSTDEGDSFSNPAKVAKLDGLMLGMRRGPRIAATEEAIVVSAIGRNEAGEDGNLFAWRSKDQGKSWQGPTRVNDAPASAREGLHAMAAGPDGACYCVWLDLRNNGTQIFISRSSDAGATWSKNRMVYKSPDGTVCECCHPTVAVDGRERVYVMWRNALAGNRDMYLATSNYRGETFADATKIGSGSWQLDACPMDGGGLAVTPSGRVATIWRRDQLVFRAELLLDQEESLGVGRQPWIAANERGHYSVWLSGPDERLYYADSSAAAPVALDDGAGFPVIAAGPSRQGPVIASWESGAGKGSEIKVIRLEE